MVKGNLVVRPLDYGQIPENGLDLGLHERITFLAKSYVIAWTLERLELPVSLVASATCASPTLGEA